MFLQVKISYHFKVKKMFQSIRLNGRLFLSITITSELNYIMIGKSKILRLGNSG